MKTTFYHDNAPGFPLGRDVCHRTPGCSWPRVWGAAGAVTPAAPAVRQTWAAGYSWACSLGSAASLFVTLFGLFTLQVCGDEENVTQNFSLLVL